MCNRTQISPSPRNVSEYSECIFIWRCVGTNAPMNSSLIYFFTSFCFHSFALNFNQAKPTKYVAEIHSPICCYCFIVFFIFPSAQILIGHFCVIRTAALLLERNWNKTMCSCSMLIDEQSSHMDGYIQHVYCIPLQCIVCTTYKPTAIEWSIYVIEYTQ